jgi:hypothetical protein
VARELRRRGRARVAADVSLAREELACGACACCDPDELVDELLGAGPDQEDGQGEAGP